MINKLDYLLIRKVWRTPNCDYMTFLISAIVERCDTPKCPVGQNIFKRGGGG